MSTQRTLFLNLKCVKMIKKYERFLILPSFNILAKYFRFYCKLNFKIYIQSPRRTPSHILIWLFLFFVINNYYNFFPPIDALSLEDHLEHRNSFIAQPELELLDCRDKGFKNAHAHQKSKSGVKFGHTLLPIKWLNKINSLQHLMRHCMRIILSLKFLL